MIKYLISLWLILNVTSLLQAQGNAIKTNKAGTLQAEINKSFIFDETKKGAQEKTLFTCNDVFNILKQLKEIANKKPELRKPELQESGARIARFSFAGEEADVMIITGRNTKLVVGFILSRDQSEEETSKLFKQFKQTLSQCKQENWREYEDREVVYEISNYSSGSIQLLHSSTVISIGFDYSFLYNNNVDEVPITCPHLIRVFDAFNNGTIRGSQTDSSERFLEYMTTINFEKQIWCRIFFSPKENYYTAQYSLLESNSEEKAKMKFAELKQLVKKCMSPDWFEKENINGSNTNIRYSYDLSEKVEKSRGKNINIALYYSDNRYHIALQFDSKKE